eukprot:comp21085_c0_seq1/m.28418 comp21085_c0_seq1/g.28418  ORF comp21085_c0_seq1/g.28418 comp21085_c0_seq1/m.28418 type:complete len:103 (-) comp21085_c0_seq1:804-1112(-)
MAEKLPVPIIKAFAAGYILSKMSRRFMFGMLVGAVAGVYADQNYELPRVKTMAEKLMNDLNGQIKPKQGGGQTQNPPPGPGGVPPSSDYCNCPDCQRNRHNT